MNKADAAIFEGHECVVLSALMNGADALPVAAEDFGSSPTSPNRIIFNRIRGLSNRGLLAVTDALLRSGELEKVGGAHRITEIATLPHDEENLKYALDQVLEQSRQIQAAKIGEQMHKGTITPEQARERLNEILSQPETNDLPAPTSIIALAEKDPADFETDNLLGNRFLCIEGGMLFIGPSGIGKSSANMQQDICFALGRPAFGIKPSRSLRTLTIQAENDDGDLAEMTRGICDHLNLTAEERALVSERVVYIKEKALTGEKFLSQLRRLVQKYRPDIVRIDPMHAYAGGDVKDPGVTTPFLRNGLNPILEEFRCAAIIVHHTPKTTNRDTSQWNQTDWMYAGAGNADVTNWARAILVVDATRVHGAFVFRAAKRGMRIGWADDDGHRVYDRLFCHHAGDAIFWREATDDDIERVEQSKAKKGERLMTKEELKALVPLDEPIPKLALIERANRVGFGINPAKRFLAVLLADKELHEWRKPRKGTCPEVLISRREERLI
jgi:hypothetical protein